MALVDYSDSDSESESPAPQPTQSSEQNVAPSSKPATKPFQKFVSRSNPGKIVVSLPTAADDTDTPSQQLDDGPPAKRARTGGGGGGGRFSNFSSFLPPPKPPSKPAPSAQAGPGKVAPRPGVHLKTAAEPAFSRDSPSDTGFVEDSSGSGSLSGFGLNLPPPKDSRSSNGPSVQPGQTPAEEVKLVGKPLMFKPLSVARKPTKKKKTNGSAQTAVGSTKSAAEAKASEVAAAEAKTTVVGPPPEKKKKVSLFSIADPSDTAPEPTPSVVESSTGAYEPLFGSAGEGGDDGAAEYDDDTLAIHEQPASATQATVSSAAAYQRSGQQAQSLDNIADDLNLSAAARRELFGRDGQPGAGGGKLVNFNIAREYTHNEAVRASGETITHNPVRAIAPGKHSLRQLVNSAQSNLSALEDSFASAKNNKRDAAGRYGWR